MEKVGYRLIRVSDDSVVQSWGGIWGQQSTQPAMIVCPNGDHVHCPVLNTEYGMSVENETPVPGTGVTLVEWMMEAPAPAVPEEISDRQFFQQLANMQVITKGEALAAVKTGEIPATLQAFIDSFEDAGQKFAAEMTVSGAVTFRRSHPMTNLLAAGMGWTAEQVDALWTAAAAL
jgi:hypothetical protein